MIPRSRPDFIEKSGSSVAYTSLGADATGQYEVFIRLSVRAGRDPLLSPAAKGVLFELSTYHDAEMPSAEDLERVNKAARRDYSAKTGVKLGNTQSHEAAMKELEHFGYLFRKRLNGAAGHPVAVRALTDTPGYHKFDLPRKYQEAVDQQSPKERRAALLDLATQRQFPRPVHAYRPEAKVISLAEHRAAREAS